MKKNKETLFLKNNPVLNRISDYFYTFYKSKWLYSVIVAIIIITSLLFTLNSIYIYIIKKDYINVFQTRNLVVDYVKNRMKKAIQIGIVDFSLVGGLGFDEVKISNEEDFSGNRIFFSSERVEVSLNSILSKDPKLKKITLYSSSLDIDINDVIGDNFLAYLKESNLPEVEFKELSITVRDGKEIIFQTPRDVSLKLKVIDKKIQIDFSTDFSINPFSGSVSGNSEIETELEKMKLEFRFKNLKVETFPGIVNKLIHFQVESGKSDGFIRIFRSPNELNLEGDVNFLHLSASEEITNFFELNDVTLNSKISYFRELDENKKEESFFNRKVSNPSFFYTENFSKDKAGLRKINYNANFNDISKLTKAISLKDGEAFQGKLKASMIVEETGKVNDWFHFDGNISLENFSLKSKNPKYEMNFSKAFLSLNSEGELELTATGKLQSSLVQITKKGKYLFTKQIQPNIEYILNSNSELDIKFDKLILKDFIDLYDFSAKKINDDIIERQEKMLPQSFISESRLYLDYIEKLNLKLNLSIDELKFSEQKESLGNVNIEGSFNKGNLDLKLISNKNSNEKSFLLESSFRGIIDKKNPYFDWKLDTENLPWKEKISEFCGSEIFSDFINLKLSFVASGNNFSDIVVYRNYAVNFHFPGTRFQETNKESQFRLSNLWKENEFYDLKGFLGGYGTQGYIQNLEIFNSNSKWGGNGSIARNSNQVSIWGPNGTIQFQQEGEKCFLQKK
ncbi:MAG: hypothetical protein SFU98_00815 [Leptospiraceae bacterium]|nr:hypothetical protein [Leptospiraceae bacterium]